MISAWPLFRRRGRLRGLPLDRRRFRRAGLRRFSRFLLGLSVIGHRPVRRGFLRLRCGFAGDPPLGRQLHCLSRADGPVLLAGWLFRLRRVTFDGRRAHVRDGLFFGFLRDIECVLLAGKVIYI